MDLRKVPGRFSGLYCATTLPVSPGATGSFDQEGVVHPQDAFTWLITKESSPVLTKVNSCEITPPSSLTTPKSCSSAWNVAAGCCAYPPGGEHQQQDTYHKPGMFFQDHHSFRLLCQNAPRRTISVLEHPAATESRLPIEYYTRIELYSTANRRRNVSFYCK